MDMSWGLESKEKNEAAVTARGSLSQVQRSGSLVLCLRRCTHLGSRSLRSSSFGGRLRKCAVGSGNVIGGFILVLSERHLLS